MVFEATEGGRFMGLNTNNTPAAERIHIGFFGKRNAGKSSVVNAVTNQELSVVSEVEGTTTDPVIKAMELLPLGPVLIIDTPGYDDEGKLGELRVRKTKQILNKTDIAVLVVDATKGITATEEELIEIFKAKDIKYIIIYNKCDLLKVSDMITLSKDSNALLVSAKDKKNISQLKEKIALMFDNGKNRNLVADYVSKNDIVILVTPIDASAPKGRLILPQQMVIRELLEAGVISVVVQVDELSKAVAAVGGKPKLVITDSQAFKAVQEILPKEISLTSFSILMSNYKGYLDTAVQGANALKNLSDGAKILICEGCTHHRQCEDIGTVKLPCWIREYTGKALEFEFTSGGDFPEDLSDFDLVIHCGGCMLPEREVMYRMKCAGDQNVPFSNYGIIIAAINGILERSLEIFRKKTK